MTFQISEFRKGNKMAVLEVDKTGVYRAMKGYVVDGCVLKVEREHCTSIENTAKSTFNRYKREIEEESKF